MRLRGSVALLAVASLVLLGALTPSALAADKVKTVATGLNNPRGLSFGPDGALYVAEAGRAGRCFDVGGDQVCAGLTGSITRLKDGEQKRIAFNFISAGDKDGSFTTGIDDVVIGPNNRPYGIITAAPPGAEAGLPEQIARQLGSLVKVTPSGWKKVIANVDEYEFQNDSDGRGVDSNPYGLAATSDGRFVVVDAAANTLLSVDSQGNVELIALFEARKFGKRKIDSVPTDVVVGPDGAYYVSELGGDGTPNGKARVWRVAPGETPAVYASGFSTVVGLAFGPDGSLYVAQLLKKGFGQLENGNFTGAVLKVAPDGTRSELAPGKLQAVGGVAVAEDGTVYVTTNAVFPGGGKVLRIKEG